MSDQLDRRTKTYKELVGQMPPINELVTEEIDGVLYQYRPEPRCHICTAGETRKGLKNGEAVRNLIDTLLLYPKSYKDIETIILPFMAEWPDKHRITYRSIRTHQRQHLPWDKLAMRMMVERWANQQKISVMDAVNRMILTEEAWLEGTVHKGWESMVQGNLQPTWGDTQKAWERLSDLKRQAEGEFSVTYLLAELDVIIEAVREVVPAEYWGQISNRIESFKRGELPQKAMVVEEEETPDELFEQIIGGDDE